MLPRSVFFMFAGVILAWPAHAGPVTGQIVDPAGRAVRGAQVLLLAERAILQSATTDAQGRFTLQAPDTGEYELRIAAAGFRADPIRATASPDARDVGVVALSISAVSESVVVSAAHVEVPLSAAAASVTVISAADIASRQLHTLADALRSVPGIAVASTGSHGAVTGVFPRGGESDYTLVFIDGVAANGFGGEFDFAHLSTANIDRIEVVRGPQSALFGSNAIGAVVRIVTRRGGPPRAGAGIEAGSFGLTRAAAQASASHSSWEWGASVERFDSGGWNGRRTAAGEVVVNDDYERHSAAASLGWRGTRGRALHASLRFGRDDRGFPGPFGTNPIGAYPGIDAISRGTYDRWTAEITATVPSGARLRTTATAGLNDVDGRFRSPSWISPDAAPVTSYSSSRRLSGRLQADMVIAAGLDASVGGELLAERAGSTFITGQNFTPVPVRRTVTALFAEGRWDARSRLFLTAGVRMDHIRRDALEPSPDPLSRPLLPSDSTTSLNPKLAAAWFVRPATGAHTKVRAAIGTGIRPPDGFEIAFTDNPSLRPERTTSGEVSLEQALAAGRVLLEATGFVNDYDDLIVAVGPFRESSRFMTDNISNARARGVELAGSARVRWATRMAADLEARTGYTLLDTEILAVDLARSAPLPFTSGDPLLRRPRHQFFVDVAVRADRLTVFVHGGGRGRTLDVEPTLGTFGGLFSSAGYAVWNGGAAWRVRQALEVFGRVENVLDRRYEQALGFPALGRGAVVGLRVAASR